MSEITLQAELSSAQASALAQFAKRAFLDTFRDRAVDEAEAYEMRDAIDVIGKALARAGYAPR